MRKAGAGVKPLILSQNSSLDWSRCHMHPGTCWAGRSSKHQPALLSVTTNLHMWYHSPRVTVRSMQDFHLLISQQRATCQQTGYVKHTLAADPAQLIVQSQSQSMEALEGQPWMTCMRLSPTRSSPFRDSSASVVPTPDLSTTRFRLQLFWAAKWSLLAFKHRLIALGRSA